MNAALVIAMLMLSAIRRAFAARSSHTSAMSTCCCVLKVRIERPADPSYSINYTHWVNCGRSDLRLRNQSFEMIFGTTAAMPGFYECLAPTVTLVDQTVLPPCPDCDAPLEYAVQLADLERNHLRLLRCSRCHHTHWFSFDGVVRLVDPGDSEQTGGS